MRDLLRSLLASLQGNLPLVYCALVETRGSTPQKPGAAMLVFPDGSQVGTLGGGCVEAEVKQQALGVLSGQRSAAGGLQGGDAENQDLFASSLPASPLSASLLTFQLDDDYGWDDGLICGGRMRMLVDPLTPGSDWTYFRELARLVESGEGCTEAVVLDDRHGEAAPPGARFLFDAAGDLIATRHTRNRGHSAFSGTSPTEAPRRVTKNQNVPFFDGLEPLDRRPRPATRNGVAYLPVLPRCRLVIVGAGHVAQAVADLAAQLDFDVWVLDDRETYCNRDRFPRAERIIVGDLGRTLPELEITPNTFCLIVTRGHYHDEEALLHLAERPARYVGMIGSKRKVRLIFDDLLAQGISQAALDRVRAPVGFDIGSQTVPEIAVSIVAQLVAERNLGAGTTASRMAGATAVEG